MTHKDKSLPYFAARNLATLSIRQWHIPSTSGCCEICCHLMFIF